MKIDINFTSIEDESFSWYLLPNLVSTIILCFQNMRRATELTKSLMKAFWSSNILSTFWILPILWLRVWYLPRFLSFLSYFFMIVFIQNISIFYQKVWIFHIQWRHHGVVKFDLSIKPITVNIKIFKILKKGQ